MQPSPASVPFWHKADQVVFEYHCNPNRQQDDQNHNDYDHVLRHQVVVVSQLKQLMEGTKVESVTLKAKDLFKVFPYARVEQSSPVIPLFEEIVRVTWHQSLQ